MGNALQDFLDEDKPSRTPSVSKNAIRSFLDDDEVEKDEPLPTIKDRSLKVDDIVNTTQYVEKIRDYMVDRKGKQFLSMDKDELEEWYKDHPKDRPIKVTPYKLDEGLTQMLGDEWLIE